MWQKITVRLTGVAPLIMHNGEMANPLNEATKALKKISSKRSKTEADHQEMARLQFQGGLYMGSDGPVVPAYVLEACIVNGAKKSKDGMIAKAGMFVEKNTLLEYDGPKDREGLWNDGNSPFRFDALVVINRSRVMSTRPIFNEWSLICEVNYDDTQVNQSQVLKWIEVAGQQVGLCDWRPRYGRFEVELID